MADVCDVSTTQLNIGASDCKKLPQNIIAFIKTPRGASIALSADASAWQAKLLAAKAARWYLFPYSFEQEAVSEDAVRQASSSGQEVQVRAGQYRYRLMFRESLEMHKAMYSHLNSGGGVYLIDSNLDLVGFSTDGVNLKPFTLAAFFPEKIQFGTGSEVSVSPVYFALRDNTELDVNGKMISFASIYNALVPLTTVNLEVVGATSASAFTLKVTSALDGVAIIGLVLADFILDDGASGVTDNGDGTYTVAGSGMETGTADLKAASALSIPGYESSGPVTVTIA